MLDFHNKILVQALLCGLLGCSGGSVTFNSPDAVITVVAPTELARGARSTLVASGSRGPYRFKSLTTGFATVDSSTGVVTALSAGPAQIQVTDWADDNATIVNIQIPVPERDLAFDGDGILMLPTAPSTSPVLVNLSPNGFAAYGLVPSRLLSAQIVQSDNTVIAAASIDPSNFDSETGNIIQHSEGYLLAVDANRGARSKWILSQRSITSGGVIAFPGPADFKVLREDPALSYDYPTLIEQSQSAFLVAGIVDTTHLQLARFLNDGTLDVGNFGDDASLPLGPDGLADVFLDASVTTKPGIHILSKGEIAVSTTCKTAGNDDMCILRFTSAGVPLLPTVLTRLGAEIAKTSVLDASERLYVVGDSGTDVVINRLLPTGNRDTTFGVNGEVVFKPTGSTSFSAAHAALTLDGRLVVVGKLLPSAGSERPGIAIFSEDGSLAYTETGFDPGGGNSDLASSVVVSQEDGRIYVAGTDGTNWFIARFWP